MKQLIYRLLSLSDDQLKKKAKINAFVSIFLGITWMAGALIVYISFKSKTANLKSDLNLLSTAYDLNLLSTAYDLIDTAVMPFSFHIFLVGLLFLVQGIMYLRLHEIIHKLPTIHSSGSLSG